LFGDTRYIRSANNSERTLHSNEACFWKANLYLSVPFP
jgi:hypothetical protein